MENSYKYFENKQCKYYPCHKGRNEINCLFCYCPMYFLDECPGNPKYIKMDNEAVIKDCTNCFFPHDKDNYEKITGFIADKIKKAPPCKE